MLTARRRFACEILLVVLATLVSYPLGLAIGSRWLLPLLNAAPAYALMVWMLRAGRLQGAVAMMLVWALALAVVGTTSFALWPTSPEPLVVNGTAYRDEMFAWIRSGAGREGEPAEFIPQHLLHLAAFVALSLATASAASIFMGAVLMNYMSFYVASLARAGAPDTVVVFFGWQPWAICRVAAFSILGVVLARPLLARWRPIAADGASSRPWIVAAGGLLLADVLLKALLAPMWGRLLRAAVP